MADRTVNVKLKADVAQYMAAMRAAGSATGDLDKAARDLRKAHDEEADAAGNVRVAEARLNELRADSKTKVSQLAAAEEQLSRAHRTLENAQDKTAASTERFTTAQKAAGERAGANLGDGMVDGFNKRSGELDTAAEKVAKRTQAQFDAMKFVGLSAGLPAAAAVGVAGAGIALAAVPLLFAGIAAKSLAHNEEVRKSFSLLTSTVRGDTESMAQVLAGPLAHAGDELTASFKRMEPQLAAAFKGSAPAIGILTEGVTGLAENAMPGLLNAVRASGPALDGMKSLMISTGVGASDMFTNMSKGSEGAGTGMKILGGTIQDLEGFAGNLFANLANGSAGPLTAFRGTLSAVEDTVLTLTSNGMPALQGATSGALGVVSGGVSILNGFAQGLGSWAGPLGSASGALFATNGIAKMFGTSIAQTGLGVGAFATTIDAAGNKTSPFKTAIEGAEGATGKLKAGAASLVSSGLNPMGLALGVGAIALDEIGRRQQEAAQKVAEHKAQVQALTDAYEKDNGVLDNNVKATIAKSLSDKNAAGNATALSIPLSTVQKAAEGNSDAMAKLTGRNGALIDSFVSSGAITKENGQALKATYDTVVAGGKASSDAVHDWGNLTEAQRNAIRASENLGGAAGAAAKSAREAHAAYLEEQTGLTGLTGAQVEARDATVEHTQAMQDQQNASLGYRGAVLSTQQALENQNKVNSDGKSTDLDRAQAQLALEKAFSAQETAAYNAAFALASNLSPAQQQSAATSALNAETIKLATSLKGPLPSSMQESISKMDLTSAKAAGLTTEVDKTGAAVYRLPNGKDIKITGDNGQANAAIQDVQNRLAAIHNKEVAVTINVRQIGSGQTAQAAVQTGRAAFNAQGNLYGPAGVGFAGGGFPTPTMWNAIGTQAVMVPPGTLKWAGDAPVPEVFAPLNGSARTRALLTTAAQHEGLYVNAQGPKYIDARGFATGELIQAEDGSWVPKSFYDKAPSGPHAMYTVSGFAKLTAEARANGISSLSAMDQNQLRTYGGWTDVTSSPVQQAISAGTAVQSSPSFSRQYSMAGQDSGGTEVRVFIGEREITNIVRTEVRATNRSLKRAVTAGSGRAR